MKKCKTFEECFVENICLDCGRFSLFLDKCLKFDRRILKEYQDFLRKKLKRSLKKCKKS